MYYPIGPGPLFRVASPVSGNVWPDPVKGEGAYYGSRGGNRYSGPHQLTVYCSEDPLVAITEGAFYQAMEWQQALASSRMRTVSYPFRSEHLFWAFRIDPRPAVIDLENALASHHFRYPPHLLLNPSRDYSSTQALADDVRTYAPPAGAGQPNPEGIKVPSARTPCVKEYQPHQLSLFVMNTPTSSPYSQRATLVAKMKIEFEFLADAPVGSVTYQSARVNWSAPRYRVTTIPGEPSLLAIPAFASRPGARTSSLNRWHRISLIF
jgi:hypothetical protein